MRSVLSFWLTYLSRWPRLAADCTSHQSFLPDLYNNIPRDAMCGIQFDSANAFVILFINIIQILLSVSGLIAVAIIIFGGAQYIMSQGEPAKITKAKDTIFNAVIGLVIVLVAFAAVKFLAGRFA